MAAAVGGVLAGALSVACDPGAARAAGADTWPPFVLVLGLLLVGAVAEHDGLFLAAGHRLAGIARSGATFYVGAALLVAVTTATLNLDTSVVFVTPILVATAARRGDPPHVVLCLSLLLANAGSLWLPGSNLTNLIVLGPDGAQGAGFLAVMWPAALAATAVTVLGVWVWGRRDLAGRLLRRESHPPFRPGLGAGAVAAVTGIVIAVGDPAPAVALIGAGALAVRAAQRRIDARAVVGSVGLPVLVGLFGVAVAMGTLGHAWGGLARALDHTGTDGGAVVAAALTVLINNLPAAALLAARHPAHPAQILVGLDLGPNLFLTGSLAWFLWIKTVRATGGRPPIARATRLGAVVVPLSMAAALGALAWR
ncbi:MAG TPA: SLC13 family permease [Acidimicrobiales bacterium]|nr:SLC13 family permease [Acidimicrobiales bacterium]